MLLFIASACPLTISTISGALKIQQKFHVLFVDRIVVGEVPVFWLICLTETSFLSSKRAMYARYSSLKARVKTMRGKWISQTFLTDHPNQVRHTNWFSCHKRLCFHSFCINYLLFFEMHYIYKRTGLLAALKAANCLSQSNACRFRTLQLHWRGKANSTKLDFNFKCSRKIHTMGWKRDRCHYPPDCCVPSGSLQESDQRSAVRRDQRFFFLIREN